jgi:hypothetical protein
MTQISSYAKGFILEVYDKQGRTLVKRYSSDEPGGLINGFVSIRYPNGTNGKFDFEAKPNLTVIEPGSITRLYYNTGQAIVPAHFGVVTSSPDPRSGGRGVYEVASGKELLKRSVCDPVTGDFVFVREPRDVSFILNELVRRYRHAALKYDPAKIPNTGVQIGPVKAGGTNLYEAIAAILEAVPTIGENDWGVDAEGYVVVRPPSGTVRLSYNEVQGQFGNIDSLGVVTKATIRIANAVSEGAIVSAGYRPSLITHSYTHPEHASWQAERAFDLPTNSEGAPVVDPLENTPNSGYSWSSGTSGWQSSASGSGVSVVISDGNLSTYAYPGSSAPGALDVYDSNLDRPSTVMGGSLTIDAPAGSYDLALTFRYETIVSTSPLSFALRGTVRYDLNQLKGQGLSEVRLVAPSPSGFVINAVTVGLTLGGTVPTTLKVHEFRGLRVNQTLLDQIARSNIRLPAREVTQITCARGFTSGGEAIGGFYLMNLGKTLEITDAPEPISGDIAEVVDTFNTKEGLLSRVSTGQPLRSPEIRAFMQLLSNNGRR